MPEVTQNTIGIQVKAEGVEQAVTGLSSLVSVLKELHKIGDKTTKITTGFEEVTKKTEETTKKVESLGSMLKKIFTTGAIAVATKAISGYVKSSMNYVEDVNLFTVSMGQFTDQAYEYAQTVSSIMGIDPGQWMRNQGTFMNIAHGFGVAADRAYIMSQQLTQLGYDLSSLFNIPVDQAMAKLGSGIAGELEPLRRIGYDLSKASLEAIALELGITKSYNAMTQAEKAQLRYYAIMTQVTVAQGDMARTLEAPANQLRVLQMQFEMTARAIGNIFIPILNALMPVVVAVIKIIRMAAESIAALFGYTLPEMNWTALTDTTSTVASDLDDAYGSAKKLKKQLAGFDEINNLTTPEPSGGGKNNTSGGWVDFELPTYDFLGEAVSNRIDEIVEKLKPLLEIIKAVLPVLIALGVGFQVLNVWAFLSSDNIGILIEKFKKTFESISAIYKLISENPYALIIAAIVAVIAYLAMLYASNEDFRNKVNEIFKQLVEWFSKFKQGVADFLKIAGEWLVNAYNKVKDFCIKVKENLGKMGADASTIVQTIKDKFKAAFDRIKEIAVNTYNGIKTTFSNIATWFGDKWNAIKTTVSEKWNALKEGAAGAWEGIKETFSPVTNWFKEKFGDAWGKVKAIFADDDGMFTFDSIKEGIQNVFKDIVNALIRGLNTVIAWPFNKINNILNWIKNIEILKYKPFNGLWSYNPISVPKIPQLAQGGVVTRSTLANIGEDGPEAIVPLKNNTDWINRVSANISDNSTNDEVVNRLDAILQAVLDIDPNVVVDIVDLTNAVRRQEKKQLRIQGV